eukprot:3356354-Amphidinium_carterae.1
MGEAMQAVRQFALEAEDVSTRFAGWQGLCPACPDLRLPASRQPNRQLMDVHEFVSGPDVIQLEPQDTVLVEGLLQKLSDAYDQYKSSLESAPLPLKPAFDETTTRIVFIGRTNSGKSSTINQILTSGVVWGSENLVHFLPVGRLSVTHCLWHITAAAPNEENIRVVAKA